MILRVGGNCHRFIIVLNGKFRCVTTHEKDFLFDLACLFSLLNQPYFRRAFTAIQFLIALALSFLLSQPVAYALPTGWEVISGDVQFDASGNTLNITSNSASAIINYQSFNIGLGETVNFMLPNSLSSILNRVIGGGPTTVLGALNGNGSVMLVNPAGINFASSAQVNVGSMIASTLNIQNNDYISGNWQFSRDGAPAALTNDGQIHAADGHVVLLGSSVQNQGQITAPLGQVALAVGDQVSVDVGPNMSLKVNVSQALQEKVAAYQDAIRNSGQIQAKQVELQAKVEQNPYASVVNMDGLIRATSVHRDETGKIVLNASSSGGTALVQNTGTMDASGSGMAANGGTVEISGDIVRQAGQLLAEAAEGGQGGYITVNSTQETRLESGSVTSAKAAGNQGDAGDIKIWSDQDTHFESGATIDVSGGQVSGDAGFVEVSGQDTVFFNGQAHGVSQDGQAGRILIDPVNIVIANGGAYDPQAGQSFNGFGSITLQATNNITVSNAFNTTTATGNPSVSLTMEADNNITLNAPVTTQNAALTLHADKNGDGTGNLTIGGAGPVSSNNGPVTLRGANISVNGVVNAGTGSVDAITSTGSGNINLAANVTGGTVNLTANSAGNINRTAGTVNATTLNMTSGSGNMGTAVARIQTNTGTLTANTTGNVFVNEANAVTVGTSNTGGEFNLTAAGNVTVNGAVNATGRVDMNTTGSILVEGTTGGKIKANGAAGALNQETIELRAGTTVTLQGGGTAESGSLLAPNGNVRVMANRSLISLLGGSAADTGAISTGGNSILDGGMMVMSGSTGDRSGSLISGGDISIHLAGNATPFAFAGPNGLLFSTAGSTTYNMTGFTYMLDNMNNTFQFTNDSMTQAYVARYGYILFFNGAYQGYVHSGAIDTNSLMVRDAANEYITTFQNSPFSGGGGAFNGQIGLMHNANSLGLPAGSIVLSYGNSTQGAQNYSGYAGIQFTDLNGVMTTNETLYMAGIGSSPTGGSYMTQADQANIGSRSFAFLPNGTWDYNLVELRSGSTLAADGTLAATGGLGAFSGSIQSLAGNVAIDTSSNVTTTTGVGSNSGRILGNNLSMVSSIGNINIDTTVSNISALTSKNVTVRETDAITAGVNRADLYRRDLA